MRDYKRFENLDYDQVLDMFLTEEAEVARLRGLIERLECIYKTPDGADCIEWGTGLRCAVCTAKLAAQSVDATKEDGA